MARHGLDKDSTNLGVLHTQVKAAVKDYNSDIVGDKVDIAHIFAGKKPTIPVPRKSADREAGFPWSTLTPLAGTG
ncbi:hypothetical protein CORC01_01088 [Colletotrichum orchidophilum]|uniref:Uncharacterized protein n=1 Tax=Colletotrichum orchidophilum TaxID=1209926 RepID=A0A1G4BQQ1_9PEZI|nr:uncharacterized protein CORC01_01088 [Colletotrichum orchidophilum]OHF03769.1 hypothetical protein CORC01_01088 [Colletotrichum orchidophilum]